MFLTFIAVFAGITLGALAVAYGAVLARHNKESHRRDLSGACAEAYVLRTADPDLLALADPDSRTVFHLPQPQALPEVDLKRFGLDEYLVK